VARRTSTTATRGARGRPERSRPAFGGVVAES